MSAPGLLADLATMMASSPEDVATRGLELLLSRSPAARFAVERLFDEWRGYPMTSPIVRWASQVVADDRSRTDLEGFTASGETAAILENKFWAGLTDNQPGAYLDRLKLPGAILAFVVPDSRQRLMSYEIILRLRARTGEDPREHRTGETAVFSGSAQQLVAVTSWSVVLDCLARAMEAANEYDNLADLRQLRALASRQDSEGFRPFLLSELTSDTPRLLLRLSHLVDSVVQSLLQHPFANKKGLKSSAALGWYGHYVRIHGYGCQIVLTAHRWAQHGISPLWLRVSGGDWSFPSLLRVSLRQAIADERWLFEEHGSNTGYWIPLRILENRDRDRVVADLVSQLLLVSDVLGLHPVKGTETVPPDSA